MKNNKTILSIFGALFFIFLLLYAYEFEIRARTDFWIIPTEIVMILAMSILLILLNVQGWKRLLFLISFIGFLIFGLPRTGIWTYSLRKYVKTEKESYLNFVTEIDKIRAEKLSYVSCYKNTIKTQPELESLQIQKLSSLLCTSIQNLDCHEVSLNRDRRKFLFVMYRFWDNGYGLLYCKDEVEKNTLYDERINGLEFTRIIKVDKNWYYVSFT